jgi:hypothetical protein
LPANFNTQVPATRRALLRAHAATVRNRVIETLGLDNTSPASPHYYLTPDAYKGFFRAVAQNGVQDADVNVT